MAFTVACALAPSMGSLIAFRFLAGFFGSCILANGGAFLADMMPAERRGVFLSLYVMGPIMSVVSSFPFPPLCALSGLCSMMKRLSHGLHCRKRVVETVHIPW